MSRTFSLGGIHPKDKKISADTPITDFPPVEIAYISMSQHLGAPSEPIVAKGDMVKCGQLIGKSSGFISANIHSPFTGTVLSVEPYPDLSGNMVTHVIIKTQEDEWIEGTDTSPALVKEIKLTKEQILKRIAECGVIGLGGAAFPTHIKLSPPPGKKADILIINGAECEPYLTSDYRLMLERGEEVLTGARIMMKALGVDKAVVGIEENKPLAVERLKSLVDNEYKEIKVVVLKKRYPQGGEKQLIDAITGRRVPSMGLPIDVGVVVQNVGTAYAVYEAVQKNKPLTDGIVTITGDSLSEQKNFRLRAGTPFQQIIDHIGGFPEEAVKIISGGPLMGKAVSKLGAATVKSTSGLLFLTAKETLREEENNCIRCAKCVEACPMGLEPYLLNKLARASRMDDLEENSVQDCIECGCCMYTCPSHIPLLDTIRGAKASVLRIMRSRSKK
ncbi:MAG: electron transport complex subunit RsxC [Bacteroidales bacterium]|nr:electron transport complex subunit RsxC [Bacteroidales bacterium]MDD2425360.1 electron transport complex subunit RsxC [Bacteroidales bacterium]MDD3989240.1 electron transport complex subunit RsxC [Bacteroidales bacterium]MDD4638401.1 electron transport complex subunit RsxC [Bacteroidales bacterium]